MKLKLSLLLLLFPTLALANKEMTAGQRLCRSQVESYKATQEGNASITLRTVGGDVIVDLVVTPPSTLSKPLVLGRADLFLDGGGDDVFTICDQDYNPVYWKPVGWDRPPWQNMGHEVFGEDGRRGPAPFAAEELTTLKPGETIKTSVVLSKFYKLPSNWRKLYVAYTTNENTVYAEISLPQAKLSGTPAAASRATDLNVTVGGTNIATYQYAVVPGATCDGATYSTEFFPLTTKITASLGADGPYTLCVKGKSSAGNTQIVPVQKSWTKDTVAPTQVTLAGTPANPSSIANLNVTVGGDGVTKYRAALKTGTGCTGVTYGATTVIATPITLAVGAAGPKTLCVKGLDAAGNIQTTPTAYSWVQN